MAKVSALEICSGSDEVSSFEESELSHFASDVLSSDESSGSSGETLISDRVESSGGSSLELSSASQD